MMLKIQSNFYKKLSDPESYHESSDIEIDVVELNKNDELLNIPKSAVSELPGQSKDNPDEYEGMPELESDPDHEDKREQVNLAATCDNKEYIIL